MRLLDVSQPVTPHSAHYPGDEPFDCRWQQRTDRGDALNLSALTSSPHVGTHVDAPLHVREGAPAIGALPVDAFVGPCVVVHVPEGVELVTPAHLRDVDPARAQRVLFRTRARTTLGAFDPKFTALSSEAARMLAEAGVRLVGTDAPSADPFASEDLPAHHVLAAAGIPIVENLLLDHVNAGAYELIAAPVLYAEMEAAPVRALLRPLN